jgi:hypothetical protein
MYYHGHIENGVVIFDEPTSLPEGVSVRVEVVSAPTILPGNGDWDSAMQAVAELEDYDFEAFRRQREVDLKHAGDHLP